MNIVALSIGKETSFKAVYGTVQNLKTRTELNTRDVRSCFFGIQVFLNRKKFIVALKQMTRIFALAKVLTESHSGSDKYSYDVIVTSYYLKQVTLQIDLQS